MKAPKDIWVIDNFYEDFESMRKLALRCRYEKKPKGKYWGRNSIDVFFPHELFEKVRKKIGCFHVTKVDSPTYNPHSTGKFRVAFEKNFQENGQIHCDYPGAFSCAVYMNTHEQCRDRIGTDFWKHKKTGNTRGYRYNWDKPQNFEIYYQTKLKPNRAVLFDASLLHSIHQNFGHSINDGRLIHIFFVFPGHSKNGINCCTRKS